MDLKEKALAMHKEWNGKLETIAKSKVNSREDLAIAYTPGVAEPCKVIAEDKEAAYTYTMKANTVAVISDGSAVLGLGNIGPYACLLYTSDAADEEDSVDLGGRRIIKKKKKRTHEMGMSS